MKRVWNISLLILGELRERECVFCNACLFAFCLAEEEMRERERERDRVLLKYTANDEKTSV